MKNIYAGIFPRIKAAFIDSVVLIIFMAMASDIFARMESVPVYYKIIAFAFIFILYEPLMVSFLGASVGHSLIKIKVIDERTNKYLPFWRALIRLLLKVSLGWISLFTIAINDKKKAIHDEVVNALVVRDSK